MARESSWLKETASSEPVCGKETSESSGLVGDSSVGVNMILKLSSDNPDFLYFSFLVAKWHFDLYQSAGWSLVKILLGSYLPG